MSTKRRNTHGLLTALLILQGARGFPVTTRLFSRSRHRESHITLPFFPPCHNIRKRECPVIQPLTSLPSRVGSDEGKSRRFKRISRVLPSQGFLRKASVFCLLTLSIIFGLKGQASWAVEKVPTVATAALASSSQSMPPTVGLTQVGLAAVLVYYSGILILQRQGLRPLAKSLLQGCFRCATQLYLAGSVILTPLLATSQPWVLAAWLIITGLLAAQEASSRAAYTYPKMRRHFILALIFSVSSVLAATAGLGIIAPTPWYHTRTWIPLMGMLMGNAVTATSLASKTLTSQLATQTSVLEYSLCRGATWREALEQVLKTAYTTALTPTINALCVTGVVFIPGMMTGQLLAGQAAYQAANYQILIYFLIAAAVTASVHTMTHLTLRSLVDSRAERLRICDKSGYPLLQPVKMEDRKPSVFSFAFARDQFVRMLESNKHSRRGQQRTTNKLSSLGSYGFPVNGGRGDKGSSINGGGAINGERVNEDSTIYAGGASRRAAEEMTLGLCDGKPVGGAELPYVLYNDVKIPSTPRPALVRYRNVSPSSSSTGSNQNDDVVLQLKDMKIDRTTVSLSLDICSNDIIGIKGPSGIGKSQILRTLVGLESLDRTTLYYRGQPATDFPMSSWRQKLALVPQDRPGALTGTPREFFERALSFHSQQDTSSQSSPRTKGILDLSTLAYKWGLPHGVLEQPWSTLSGGEAQRMSLAIAIALKPEVLLLDESTSALDESTTLAVENTLRSLNIPIIIVSHDRKQLGRLSNRIIDLVPADPFSSLRGL